MAKLRKIKMLFFVAVLFLHGCHGCLKPNESAKPDDVAVKRNDSEFSLSAQQIFAHANHFTYRSDMQVISKQASVVDEDSESIEIIGAKPRIHLKKKTDTQHFIEIIADNDTYFVRNGGKDFRHGADNNPLYPNLINDSFNLLSVLVHDFALKDRIELKQASQRKTYTIIQGPVSLDAPYVEALTKKLPAFSEAAAGDATGSFVVDEKTGLLVHGNLAISILGKDNRSITIKASFRLDIASHGDAIALPQIRDEEPVNFPVDIGRKFNEMMGEKESK